MKKLLLHLQPIKKKKKRSFSKIYNFLRYFNFNEKFYLLKNNLFIKLIIYSIINIRIQL